MRKVIFNEKYKNIIKIWNKDEIIYSLRHEWFLLIFLPHSIKDTSHNEMKEVQRLLKNEMKLLKSGQAKF